MSDAESVERAGYKAQYVADLEFKHTPSSAGVIIVDIPEGMKTTPHAHEYLEELFIPMNRTRMGIDDSVIELEKGDVVLVASNEKHWFETYSNERVRVIAIKFPNLKDDKIE